MADNPPRLVMIAGPNGSGKSTLIMALRADPRFELPAQYLNADDLQRARRIDDPRQAQQLANELRAQALASRQDVMYETVMSHPGKIAELQQAKSAGYHIIVLLVATNDPNVNVERVAARVAAGGHDVPEDRTRERYARTLALAPVAIGYANQAFVFDNTRAGETGGGLSQQAGLLADRLVTTGMNTAPWVARLVKQVNERAKELQAFAHGAQRSGVPPQLARLHDSQTSGPIMVVGNQYVLQYDELTRTSILHDRSLLGPITDRLAVRLFVNIRYDEGVATEHAPQRGRASE